MGLQPLSSFLISGAIINVHWSKCLWMQLDRAVQPIRVMKCVTYDSYLDQICLVPGHYWRGWDKICYRHLCPIMLCVQSLMLACKPMFQILIHLLQNYSRSGQRVTDSVRVWACSTHCAYKHLHSISSSSSASVASWKIWQYCTAALKWSHFTKNVVHVEKNEIGPKNYTMAKQCPVHHIT